MPDMDGKDTEGLWAPVDPVRPEAPSARAQCAVASVLDKVLPAPPRRRRIPLPLRTSDVLFGLNANARQLRSYVTGKDELPARQNLYARV